MKKFFVFSVICICISIVICLGFFALKEENKYTIENKNNSEIAESNSINHNVFEETSYEEEKISHIATLIINKYYKDCEHTMTSSIDIPYDMVNMNREEVKEKYPTWEILDFNKNEVSIYKEFEGICNEHYEVSTKDGYIIVYNLDEDNERRVYEITDISTEYLPPGDISELKKGIRIEGITELNSLMENYE